MKITKIDARVCNAVMRNWIFVRVETDRPGLVGWGEATLEWKTRAVAGAIEDLTPLLIGKDPRDIEQCTQTMIRHSFWRMGVIGMSAVSGIEIALWDILGKTLGVPVWRLLGGKTRDYLRTYTHLGFGEMEAVYETADAGKPGRARTRGDRGGVRRAQGRVHSLHALPFAGQGPGTRGRNDGGAAQGGRPGCRHHGRFPRPSRVRGGRNRLYIQAIAPARVMFAEEPVPPEDLAGLVALNARSPVPIAAGERLIGRREFAPAIHQRAFAVAQPDICHTGGLLETKKIAAMAESAGIGLAPHNPLGPIAGAAALHFGISTPNVIIQEEMSGTVPWYDSVVTWPIERTPGRWDAPGKPGLGIEVNEEANAAHPFEQEVLSTQSAVLPDGTIADW